MSQSIDDLLRDLQSNDALEGGRQIVPGVQAHPVTKSSPGGAGTVFLIAALLLIAVMGSLPFGAYALYPFTLFVTLLHETGHALATIATGGSVASIRISPDTSGLTGSSGGIQALIAPAGYLGATLAGVAVLLTPLRFARWVIGAMAAVPLAALLFFHPDSWFTALWCIAFCLSLGLAAWKIPPRFLAFLQIFLGVEAGLNAFRDLSTLVLISESGAHIQNDAQSMSKALFLPPLLWAISWTVISVALLLLALIGLVRRDWPALASSLRGRKFARTGAQRRI